LGDHEYREEYAKRKVNGSKMRYSSSKALHQMVAKHVLVNCEDRKSLFSLKIPKLFGLWISNRDERQKGPKQEKIQKA